MANTKNMKKRRQTQRKLRTRGRASQANTAARGKATLTRILQKDQLSMEEIMFLWVAMGGALTGPKGAAVAAAVAYQENGGKTKGCAGCCCGLWMYNVIPVPSNPCSNTIRTVADAENVFKTTRCTVRYVKAHGWEAWEAHPSGGGNYGNYYNYLREAQGKLQAANKPNPNGPGYETTLLGLDIGEAFGRALGPFGEGLWNAGKSGVEDPGNITKGIDLGLGSVNDFFGALADPAFWLKVGKVVIGAALILMAANALSKALTGVSASDIVSTAPAGRIAKGAKSVVKTTSKVGK